MYKKRFYQFLLVSFIFILSLITNHIVHAHSEIDEVNPGINEILEYSPDRIEVIFADPVEIYSESIRMISSSGNVIETSKPVLDSANKRGVILPIETPLPAGRYTVEILAIAQDGHEISARYQFEIKKGMPADSDFWRNLSLVKSIPADGEITQSAPTKLEIWFSDDVELDVIGLYDDNQRLVRVGNSYPNPANPRHYIVELEEELRNGSYEVNWYASRDNKSKNGILYFAVGEVTSIVPPEGTSMKFSNISKIGLVETANWLSYIGVFVLFGGLFFQLFVAKREGNSRCWQKASFIFYLISLFGFILLFSTRMYEFSNISFTEFIHFQFVWGILLQFIFVLIAFALKSKKTQCLLLAGVVMMWAFSGHAVSERYGGIPSILLDAVHLFSTAIWFGGLFALLLMVPKENQKQWLLEKGKQFSKYAVISILLMLVTGVSMLYRYLPSFSMDSLMMSGWGQFLLIKVVLLFAIILLGFIQRNMIQDPLSGNAKKFITIWRMEIVIGVSIIFFASSLVNASPRTAEQGIYLIGEKREVEVSFEIPPFKAGYNDLVMFFQDPKDIKSVDVEFFMPPNTRRTHSAFSVGEGIYKITGGIIHASGTLYVTLHLTMINGEVISIPYEVSIPGEM